MEKQILDLFINNVPQFVFWKDLNCVYLGSNENFAKSAGFDSPDQLIGKTDYDLPWSKEEADFFRETDLKVMSSKKPQLNFEEPMTLKDGSTRWLSTSKTPLLENNEVIGILGWYNDITPYKQMEIEIDEKNKTLLGHSFQLEKSKKALEVANYDLEKFTYAVSHDLKAPIRTIISYAQLIQTKQKNIDPKIQEYLSFILESGKRMNNLVGDIMTYAQTGASQLEPEKINMSNLVSNKILDLKEMIESKSAQVDINLDDTSITCYPELVGLVFYNLINNGIKFNESERPTVICSGSETDSDWIFSVRDNGIGIDSTYADQVFQPFKRLQNESYEGSGIGLSICQRIVNIHKGKIWLENGIDGGSNFQFSISKNL